jgi:uridine kinase
MFVANLKKSRRIISICGPSGAGKSFLVKKFTHACVVSTDNFYYGKSKMKQDEKGNFNFDSPDAINLEECAEAIKKLSLAEPGSEVWIPTYDMKTSERVGKQVVIAPLEDGVIVLEGIFAFHPPLLELANFRIFMEPPQEVILARRYRRDIQERGRTPVDILQQYPMVIAGYEQYIKPVKQFADLVIDFGILV